MRQGELLFNSYDLGGVLEGHRKKAEAAVAALPAPEVAPEVEEPVLDRLEQEYRVVPLELLEDQVTVDQEEAQVDVSGDRLRLIRDRSRPFNIPGQRVRYYVPYRGDNQLWRCQPSSFTMNPPGAEVGDAEVIFEFTVPGADIAQTKGWYESALANVRQWIGFARQDVDAHNQQVRPVLRDALRKRRDLLTKAAAQVEALGLPVRKKMVPRPEPPSPVPPSPRSTRRIRQPAAEALAYDVALSFAGEDRDYVERVATLLRESAIKVFLRQVRNCAALGSEPRRPSRGNLRQALTLCRSLRLGALSG